MFKKHIHTATHTSTDLHPHRNTQNKYPNRENTEFHQLLDPSQS